MRRPARSATTTPVRAALASLAALALLSPAAEAGAQYAAYGITNGPGGQQLVRFNTATPGAVALLGPTGAALAGIDFRPATGTLYGFSGTQLYTVNVETGAATLVAATSSTTGTPLGFDFNPVPDRIRIVDPSGTNLRVNPANGVAIVDGSLAYAAGDANAGASPNVTAVAYTNNFAGATTTTLYGIDGSLGNLVRIAPPNNGVVNTVGSLGFGGGVSGVNGFDIVTDGGLNLAFLSLLGAGGSSTLYTVNLASGAATAVGAIGVAGGLQGLALAPVPEPGTYVLVATGLVAVAGMARRRRDAR